MVEKYIDIWDMSGVNSGTSPKLYTFLYADSQRLSNYVKLVFFKLHPRYSLEYKEEFNGREIIIITL